MDLSCDKFTFSDSLLEEIGNTNLYNQSSQVVKEISTKDTADLNFKSSQRLLQTT